MAKTITVIPSTINPLTRLARTDIRKRRTAGYARVSTDSDEQFTSYEAKIDYDFLEEVNKQDIEKRRRCTMILITGANGFVGQRLMETVKGAAAAPSLRNATQEDIKRIIEESGAETIIHTAAISDMGVCESDPEGSFLANVQIPLWIAQASSGRKLICFSSDQVYSGSKEDGPYSEEMVAPGNVYSSHKLEMEQRVLDVLPDAVMLRAEWMYDVRSPKPNYILNILRATDRVAFSSRQYRGVTYLREVAENMGEVIALSGGAYNFGSETTQSMYEITKQLAEQLGKNLVVEDAPPRHNLWMNCGKAKNHGVCFSDVLIGLTRCLRDYGII